MAKSLRLRISCLVNVRWLLESAEGRTSHRLAEANHQQGGENQKRLGGVSWVGPGTQRQWLPGAPTLGVSNTCRDKGKQNNSCNYYKNVHWHPLERYLSLDGFRADRGAKIMTPSQLL